MSTNDTSGAAAMRKALQTIAAGGPDNEPEEEDYDDTESAYNNGLEVASHEAATIAREALELAGDAGRTESAAVVMVAELAATLRLCRRILARETESGATDHTMSDSFYDRAEAVYGEIDRALSGIPTEPADASAKVRQAIGALRFARDRLAAAKAPRATDKVRRALKSAEGAARNVACRAAEIAYQAERDHVTG